MIGVMLNFSHNKKRFKRINKVRLDPLVDQVKKILSSSDQNLILMVKN